MAFNEDLRWVHDFLRDFYRRLNLYIDKDFTADYRITVNGENTRNFRFMDTDNNVQYWKVAINMQRKERTGGDRYSPAGTYEGDAAADTPTAPGTTKNTGKSPVKEIFGEAAPELPKLPERSGAGYSKADYSFVYDPSRYDNGPVDEEIVKAGEALAMLGLVNSDENATYEPEYDSYTSVPEYENIDVSDIDKYFEFFKENDSST